MSLPALAPPGAPVRLVSPDDARVRLDLDAYCWTCTVRHRLGRTPQDFYQELWEWEAKHRDHDFELLSPKRRLPPHYDDSMYEAAGVAPHWLTIPENANVKLAYVSSAALTITLTSLASSAAFLSGQESLALDNSSGLYLDHRVTAKIRTGTTPTVDTEIRMYGHVSLTDTPTYIDQMTGANAARNVTNAYILDRGLILLGATAVSATSNVDYYIHSITVAEAFGFADRNWGLYVTHNTVAALNATQTAPVLTLKSAYLTSI